MITLSDYTIGLALLHQVEEIYGKVYTSDFLLEMVLYWGISCRTATLDFFFDLAESKVAVFCALS